MSSSLPPRSTTLEQENASTTMNETSAGSMTHTKEQAPSLPTAGAVQTVGKENAVTTTTPVAAGTAAAKPVPAELFVANVDGKYVRFEKLEHVPAGCRTYTNKKELLGQTQKQVEAVYAHVKGIPHKTFKDNLMEF